MELMTVSENRHEFPDSEVDLRLVGGLWAHQSTVMTQFSMFMFYAYPIRHGIATMPPFTLDEIRRQLS